VPTARIGPEHLDDEHDDELVVLVVRVAKAIVERVRAEHPDGAASPMTVVHGLAARYLVGRTDVTTVELARYLGITKQSASEVVALLEGAGIVRRAPHPSDGRARVLLLTEEGAAKLGEGRCRWQEIEDEWAELVGREHLDAMRVALEGYLAAHDHGVGESGPCKSPDGESPDCKSPDRKSIDPAALCGETVSVADGKEDVST
jgi:DNA-binding MarR family transcriptional regulator